MYEILFLKTIIKIAIMVRDSNPPHKLKKLDAAPLVRNTNPAFKIAIVYACRLFKKNKAYITGMLDSPIFTPGTAAIIGGKELSTTDSTMAMANNKPVKTNLCVFFKFRDA